MSLGECRGRHGREAVSCPAEAKHAQCAFWSNRRWRCVPYPHLILLLASVTCLVPLGGAQNNRGWSATLDGSTASALVTPPIKFNKTFTFEGWFYMTRAPVAGAGTVSDSCTEFFYMTGTYDGVGFTLRVFLTSTGMRNQLYITSPANSGWGSATVFTASTWPLNTWVHVAVGHDGAAKLPIWINGMPVASDGAITFGAGNASNINTGLVVGGASGSANSFRGFVDEVRAWETLRTTAEVVANMYTTMPPGAMGLIAYYTFDEGSADARSIADRTAARTTGALTLPAGASIRAGGAPTLATAAAQGPQGGQGWGVALDGSATSALVTPPIRFNKTFTVEAWFYMTRAPVTCAGSSTDVCTEFFFLSGTYNGGSYRLRVSLTSTGLRNQLWTGANGWGSNTVFTSSTWPLNTWVHLAAGHDGSTALPLWLNGAVYSGGGGLSFGAGDFPNINTGLVVGGAANSANSFRGFVDEVRVWDRLRTTAQIVSNMYATMPPDAMGLIAYYTFDEGFAEARSVPDQTARKTTGALALPSGARLSFPGVPTLGSWSGRTVRADFTAGASIVMSGNVKICMGACP
eukprot:tig00020848_g14579.t1